MTHFSSYAAAWKAVTRDLQTSYMVHLEPFIKNRLLTTS